MPIHTHLLVNKSSSALIPLKCDHNMLTLITYSEENMQMTKLEWHTEKNTIWKHSRKLHRGLLFEGLMSKTIDDYYITRTKEQENRNYSILKGNILFGLQCKQRLQSNRNEPNYDYGISVLPMAIQLLILRQKGDFLLYNWILCNCIPHNLSVAKYS